MRGLNCSGACAFVEVKLIDGVRMLTSRHQEQNLCIDIGVLISETKKTIACIAKDRLVLDMWKRNKTSKEFASTPGQRLLQKHIRGAKCQGGDDADLLREFNR